VNVDGLQIGKGYPVKLMGILNLSPESFYKKTSVNDKSSIQELVETMEREGADIIDVGAASTAPSNVYGTPTISEQEELDRIKSSLGYITDATNLPLSIDTVSSEVARTALDMGVSIINDISGMKADAEMLHLAHSRDVPIILLANCDPPCSSISLALSSLEESYARAINDGIGYEKIILDPGIGFGKPADVDFEILGNLHLFTKFGQPLLVGVSRKAFIGGLLNQQDPEDRLAGSLAATTIAVYNGANLIRTHDIQETKMAIRIGETAQQAMNGGE
jgi:dihydropteroate synthase